MNIILSSFQR